MLKSMYTVVSIILAAIGAYAVSKYSKYNPINAFLGMIIAGYILQVIMFIWLNYKHYFVSYIPK